MKTLLWTKKISLKEIDFFVSVEYLTIVSSLSSLDSELILFVFVMSLTDRKKNCSISWTMRKIWNHSACRNLRFVETYRTFATAFSKIASPVAVDLPISLRFWQKRRLQNPPRVNNLCFLTNIFRLFSLGRLCSHSRNVTSRSFSMEHHIDWYSSLWSLSIF